MFNEHCVLTNEEVSFEFYSAFPALSQVNCTKLYCGTLKMDYGIPAMILLCMSVAPVKAVLE